jgi:hypothetical protein
MTKWDQAREKEKERVALVKYGGKKIEDPCLFRSEIECQKQVNKEI